MQSTDQGNTPGKPPAWTPLSKPIKLREDDGNYFRDQNAARYPAHPLEPAVRAILTSQPDFPSSSIDLFACGSTLGNLLRFVRKIDKTFRILVEVVGDTVFFLRRENSPTELIPDVRGFGHTFPEAYTTWEVDVKGSESHQRILQYKFAGLDCLVRFEADGYHKNLVPGDREGQGSSAEDNSLDSLVSSLGDSTISAYPSGSDRPLNVIRGGQPIPQSAVFDLKTRSIYKKEQSILDDVLPRLWVAQIPNFILAYHSSGLFEQIQTRDMRAEVQRWERENEDTLRRFAALLRKLVDFARGTSNGKFEIRRREVDVLELREQCADVGSTLSSAIEDRWVLGAPVRQQRLAAEETKASRGRSISVSDKEPVTLTWEDGPEDFTACSTVCGYCGRCAH